jgi:hypothetical protein
MQRRGFLGALVTLPILAGFKSQLKDSPMTMAEAEKVLNTSIDDPVWQSMPCSGTFDKMNIVAGSDTFIF